LNRTGQWHVFTGNELGSLLAWWAIYCYRQQHADMDLSDCYLLASTVSSKMLKSIAKVDGLNFEETLTGFKWMGNRSVELMDQGKTVLYAFEEAIGFMFSSTVLDKDGVSAACHLATMCSYLAAQPQPQTLASKLNELYETYGYHYSLVSYFLCYDPPTIERIFKRIRCMDANGYPGSVLGGRYPIASIRDLTTGVDTAQSDGKARLPCSKSSQMITFTFGNGAVVTLRTSGTEPKIKYYAELCGAPGDSDWDTARKTLGEMVTAIVEEMLQPGVNGLCAKSD
jgi:phosphomannomutase